MSRDENKNDIGKTVSKVEDISVGSSTGAVVGAVVGSIVVPGIGTGIGSLIGAVIGSVIGPLFLKSIEATNKAKEVKLEDVVNDKAILMMEFMRDNPEVKLEVLQRGVLAALNKDDVLRTLEGEGVEASTATKINTLAEKIVQGSE